MARLGFDFNACIYDGISYLSRAQESTMKHLMGNSLLLAHSVQSTPASSVADSVFVERIKSRVRTWRSACKDSEGRTEDPLIKSLRKVVLGDDHGSRPSMDIDVCSERQVQLVLDVLKEYSDDIVPLLIPIKRGGTQGVRVVLTSSKEDRILFEKELRDLEEEQSKRVRGFREVIDMISASQKPIVAHNSLDDFSFIHSRFLSPLPPTVDEFKVSLRSIFPYIIDLGHLMKEISPLRSMNSLPAASSFLRNRFFAPVDIDIPLEGAPNEMKEGKIHGHNVLRISHLFAKLSSVLKLKQCQVSGGNSFALENYANSFGPCCENALEASDEDGELSSGSMRRLMCDDLVFLWGFRNGSSAGELKRQLSRYHEAFSEEFDVKLIDKSCAVVAFWRPGLVGAFLDAVNSEGSGHEGVREMMSEGLRIANYGTYKRVCEMGIWNSDLADSLDQAVRSTDQLHIDSHARSPYEIWWDDNTVINLDEL